MVEADHTSHDAVVRYEVVRSALDALATILILTGFRYITSRLAFGLGRIILQSTRYDTEVRAKTWADTEDQEVHGRTGSCSAYGNGRSPSLLARTLSAGAGSAGTVAFMDQNGSQVPPFEPEEYARLEAAADIVGKSPEDFVHDAALKAAEDPFLKALGRTRDRVPQLAEVFAT
ncbi:hypothetical protein [Streptomyces sp. NPDC048256]|uniref:hypothetical protein n=1 Tax=unclassified Streptomyces TaxID=2593676 RepID=UPI003404F3BD